MSLVALTVMSALLLPIRSSAADTAGACDRNCLEKLVGDYAAALVKHDPDGLRLAANIKVSDNGQVVKLGAGDSWKITAFKSQPQYVADVPAQEVGYAGVVDDNGRPAFFALRLKLSNNQIVEAESILTHDGEGGPAFEPEGFIYREAPYIRDVPKQKHNSRAELLKVANTYWDVATSTHDGSKIPDAVDCWHFENGMNTSWERPMFVDEQTRLTRPEYQPQEYDGRIWTCAREIYLTSASWAAARDRHFIVDEDRGLVFSLAYVDSKGRGTAGNAGGGATAVPTGTAPPAGAEFGPKSPIEGPGGAPLGMSMAGFRAAMSGTPRTMAHYLLMRIVGGQITREQDVMHELPVGTKRTF